MADLVCSAAVHAIRSQTAVKKQTRLACCVAVGVRGQVGLAPRPRGHQRSAPRFPVCPGLAASLAVPLGGGVAQMPPVLPSEVLHDCVLVSTALISSFGTFLRLAHLMAKIPHVSGLFCDWSRRSCSGWRAREVPAPVGRH